MDRRLIMMGLPKAGKTTLLAALWHLVESKEIPNSSLRIDHLDGDRTYLDQIRKQWQDCVELDRTDSDTTQSVAMRLLPARGGVPFVLHIPDIAGETYASQWEFRRWPRALAEKITLLDGLVLVIHTDQNRKPRLLTETRAALDGAGVAAAALQEEESLPTWSADEAPTQVQLVDLLQFVVATRTSTNPLRVAILLTAWDLVPKSTGEPTPEAFLEEHLPLLDQYLRANPQWVLSRAYGVSAQGGSYGDSVVKQRLRGELLHAERIQICGPDCESHDLSAPIFWLLE